MSLLRRSFKSLTRRSREIPRIESSDMAGSCIFCKRKYSARAFSMEMDSVSASEVVAETTMEVFGLRLRLLFGGTLLVIWLER